MPKVTKRLTEKEVLAAKPGDTDYFLFDSERLRLLVRPKGSKVWQLPFKHAGKNNIYTIGRFNPGQSNHVSLSEARKQVFEVKDLLNQGINPNQHKKAQRQANVDASVHTFESVAREWYERQDWTPKHAKNIMSRLQKDVFPIIGFKPITTVTVPDIVAILHSIERRGAGDVARRISQYCTQIFEYAIAKGISEQNPAMGRARVLKPMKRKNRDHMTADELPAFLQALDATTTDHALMPLAVRFHLLTFVRPEELREAHWDEIDEAKALWSIPAARMKKTRDHIVPLSRQALEVLKKLRQLTGNQTLLFPGRIQGKPFSDVAHIKAVKKLSDGNSTPHGFRHTASTILHEKGFPSDHVEMQLSHVEENKVKGTYNKALYLDQRREMMQWWADYLDGVRDAKG